VASAACYALRLHASAAPPRGGLTQALGSMFKIIAAGLMIGLSPLSILAAETGSVCIASVPINTSGTKSMANSTASTVPYEFTVSFNNSKPVTVSHSLPVLVPKLALAKRHRVQIKQAGSLKTSFTFRFSEHKSSNLCLWFNPLYETWSLSTPGKMRWCRCAHRPAA
jgi:hypothetical protein